MKLDLQLLLYPLMISAIFFVQIQPDLLTPTPQLWLILFTDIVAWCYLGLMAVGILAVIFASQSQTVQKTLARAGSPSPAQYLISLGWSLIQLTIFWFYGDQTMFLVALNLMIMGRAAVAAARAGASDAEKNPKLID